MNHWLLLATLAMIALPAIAADPPDGAATVASDGNAFAFDLQARLRAGESGNLFFSPQSISTALAMTYAGARGDTATEMARTLHFSLPQDRSPQPMPSCSRRSTAPGRSVPTPSRSRTGSGASAGRRSWSHSSRPCVRGTARRWAWSTS